MAFDAFLMVGDLGGCGDEVGVTATPDSLLEDGDEAEVVAVLPKKAMMVACFSLISDSSSEHSNWPPAQDLLFRS